MPVEIVHWNPLRPILPGWCGQLLPLRRAVNNFGDLLGPVIVAELLRRESLVERPEPRRLLAVGSIMHLARANDVIWGIGVNGKSKDAPFSPGSLDVRAIRGPLTRAFLSRHGAAAPAVFGDPALLVGQLWSRAALAQGQPGSSHVIVPNFHDWEAARARSHVVSPTAPLWSVIGRIAAADRVVGSSLHAIIVAESLGIPARLFRSSTEPLFKYEDYYRGTGRARFTVANDIDAALKMGGEPLPTDWDPAPLLAAFPRDLWSVSESCQRIPAGRRL
jgi:pyruvyltransferase